MRRWLVVVFLHGCGADPAAYGFDRYADALGFVVAYPRARTTLIIPPRPLAAYYVWGTRDATTPYLTGRLQLTQWLLRNDLADDGLPDLSMPLLPTSTQLRLGTGGVPTFLVEHYRDARACADVDFATGVGMGHIPNFDWPAVFPALASFLLSHRLSGC